MINKISKTWNNKLSLYKFLKTILKKNYKDDEEIIKLFNKTKPELLLLKFLFDNDKNIYNFYKNRKSAGNGGFLKYIGRFLEKLNVKVMDISIINNKILFNINKYLIIYLYLISNLFYKDKSNPYIFEKVCKKIEETINKNKDNEEEIRKQITDIPDVLVITYYDDNINNYIINDIIKRLNKTYYGDNYNININELKKLKDIIEFNGYKYKLDGVILQNYNMDGLIVKLTGAGHAVAGITCNNKRYFYNGHAKDGKHELNKYINIEPCKLVEFDCDIHKDIKFKIGDCKLEKIKQKKILIYYFHLIDILDIYYM